MGGLSKLAAHWVQRQRPMWREHDANLASIWNRTDVVGRPVALPDVIVLPDIVALTDGVRPTGALLADDATPVTA